MSMTMYPSSDGYFQQDNKARQSHKARIISNWFLEHENEFTVLMAPQSPDLNPIEHLWDLHIIYVKIAYKISAIHICHTYIK